MAYQVPQRTFRPARSALLASAVFSGAVLLLAGIAERAVEVSGTSQIDRRLLSVAASVEAELLLQGDIAAFLPIDSLPHDDDISLQVWQDDTLVMSRPRVSTTPLDPTALTRGSANPSLATFSTRDARILTYPLRSLETTQTLGWLQLSAPLTPVRSLQWRLLLPVALIWLVGETLLIAFLSASIPIRDNPTAHAREAKSRAA